MYFVRQWYALADEAVEDADYDFHDLTGAMWVEVKVNLTGHSFTEPVMPET